MSNPIEAIRKGMKISLRVGGVKRVAHAVGWIAQPAYGTDWDRMSKMRVGRVESAWEGHKLPRYAVSVQEFGTGKKPKFREANYVHRTPTNLSTPVIYESDVCSWEVVGWLRKEGRSWVSQDHYFTISYFVSGSPMRRGVGTRFMDAAQAVLRARELMVEKKTSEILVTKQGLLNGKEVEMTVVYRNTQDWGAVSSQVA